MNKKIIISGPPGSGKTTIINELNERGYICAEEINPENIRDPYIKNNKKLLSEFLFQSRKDQYNQITNELVFYDRSMIDVVAYLNYWKKTYPKSWNEIIKIYKYSNTIFYTPSWKEIYTISKNRPETYTESKLIESVLKKTYLDFGYKIIEVPKLDVKKRASFIINNI